MLLEICVLRLMLKARIRRRGARRRTRDMRAASIVVTRALCTGEQMVNIIGACGRLIGGIGKHQQIWVT